MSSILSLICDCDYMSNNPGFMRCIYEYGLQLMPSLADFQNRV